MPYAIARKAGNAPRTLSGQDSGRRVADSSMRKTQHGVSYFLTAKFIHRRNAVQAGESDLLGDDSGLENNGMGIRF